MRVFVTGASGFVGKHLTDILVKNGHKVYAAVSTGENKIENAVLLSQGLFGIDWQSLPEIDAMFHLGANNDTQSTDARAMFKANIDDASAVFNECIKRKCQKFIWASSAAVYGNNPAPYFETDKTDNTTGYAFSKEVFEHWSSNFQKHYNVQVTGFRFCNIYGPGEDHKGKRRSMIGHMIQNVIERKPVRLFKYGEQQRDWLYIADAVKIMLLALEKDVSGIFNAGTGIATSFNDLFQKITTQLGTVALLEYIDQPFTSYQNHTCCNIDKAKKELGFVPDYDIDQGIEKYLEYAKLVYRP